MRILISRFSWQPQSIGGGELSAYQHAKIIKRDGHDVTFLTNVESSLFPDAKRLPIPGQRHLQMLLATFILPWYLIKRYDVINPHSRVDQIIFTLLKPLHKTPVVWKDAGDLIHQIKQSRSGIFEKYNQNLYINALKKADSIYMLNKEDRAIILDRLSKLGNSIDNNKLLVIPTSISFDDYNVKAKPILKSNKLVVGSLGRIDIFHKGLDLLVDILNKFPNDSYEWWIVGSGPDEKKLKTMTEGMPVKFFGYQKDPSRYLVGMDVFVQPSRFEGFGRTVKEAMYFGLPVVGTNTGGIPDQIENGVSGLLFEKENKEDLRKKLNSLIQDKNYRQKIGKQARIKAINDGDIELVIKDMVLPLFDKIIREKNENTA